MKLKFMETTYMILNSVSALEKKVRNKRIYVQVKYAFVHVTKSSLMETAQGCRSFTLFSLSDRPDYIFVTEMFNR